MQQTAIWSLLCVTSYLEGQWGLEPRVSCTHYETCSFTRPTGCLSCSAVPGPGVLHSGSADFESVDDLVEAVGELLQEVSGDSKDDAGIRAVCQRMYNTLRL